ncbi:PREDICTED: myotubularin-related protein 9-like [Amphimedon queenslandica]|uniref:Myotubularin phosphatase domain-containing protein n=1 Tax=Amphimedon queenslandica TaxID=400682 RepID=A0A1X7UZ17_AMPQE|nr:PREDICTED: myotubularin-related protein 9-like [Amphimedon queenslandica]|eukprot:XP_019851708.1 PREDICTED: myotubularin-related protein 9-like [Amphimedon queenslandica]
MDLMEKVKRPVVEKVCLVVNQGEVIEGALCVTAFHFVFSTRIKAQDEIMFLHTSILLLERQNPSTGTLINVTLKDFRRFSIDFPDVESCNDVFESLEMLSHPGRIDKLHPFFFRPRIPPSDIPPFSPENMTSLFTRYKCPPDDWRVSDCNRGYKLCSSHPEEVIIPAKINDQEIGAVASFRQHGKFPILSYYNSKQRSVILRCGEPLCGTTLKRCKEDIKLLNSCLKIGKGRIFDIRTQQAAQHHMSKGGGVEFPSNYSQWRVEYGSMESITNIQSSYLKLIDVCSDVNNSSWYGRLESSGWLTHVEQLLRAVKHVVHSVYQEGTSVVLHGTNGCDGTLQVSSLAILLMDPQARTIRGFLQLIEREWLQGGHPFSLRHNIVSAAPEKQKGPIFLLFLDAVWQIMRQYPLSFEFNELLLHILFVHSYSSSYGTFLYDNPAERDRHKLREKTESLWDYILLSPDVMSSIINPLYSKNSTLLVVSVHPCSIVFWKRLYLRTDLSPTLSLESHEVLLKLKAENEELKEKLIKIRKELDEVQSKGREYSSVWS